MTINEKQTSAGKIAAVFAIAGPPPAALVFWLLVAGADLTKINEAIGLALAPTGLLITYSAWIVPSLLTFSGYSIATVFIKTAGRRILAAACIGAFIHFAVLAIFAAVLGPHAGLWQMTAFAGAGGAASASLCVLIINIYLVPHK